MTDVVTEGFEPVVLEAVGLVPEAIGDDFDGESEADDPVDGEV